MPGYIVSVTRFERWVGVVSDPYKGVQILIKTPVLVSQSLGGLPHHPCPPTSIPDDPLRPLGKACAPRSWTPATATAMRSPVLQRQMRGPPVLAIYPSNMLHGKENPFCGLLPFLSYLIVAITRFGHKTLSLLSPTLSLSHCPYLSECCLPRCPYLSWFAPRCSAISRSQQ